MLGDVIRHANQLGKESEEVGTATLGALLMQRQLIEEGEREVCFDCGTVEL